MIRSRLANPGASWCVGGFISTRFRSGLVYVALLDLRRVASKGNGYAGNDALTSKGSQLRRNGERKEGIRRLFSERYPVRPCLRDNMDRVPRFGPSRECQPAGLVQVWSLVRTVTTSLIATLTSYPGRKEPLFSLEPGVGCCSTATAALASSFVLQVDILAWRVLPMCQVLAEEWQRREICTETALLITTRATATTEERQSARERTREGHRVGGHVRNLSHGIRVCVGTQHTSRLTRPKAQSHEPRARGKVTFPPLSVDGSGRHGITKLEDFPIACH